MIALYYDCGVQVECSHGLDENHLRSSVMVWMRIICGVRQLARTRRTEIDGEEEADKPQGFPNTANSTSCTGFFVIFRFRIQRTMVGLFLS